MNEPSTTRKIKTLRSWIWYWIPVGLTGLYHTLGTLDYNYTANIELLFSIPYFVVAAIIGIRRGSHIKISDFLFLVFGDFLIITLLWHLKTYFGL